jgi:hypothetical protein
MCSVGVGVDERGFADGDAVWSNSRTGCAFHRTADVAVVGRPIGEERIARKTRDLSPGIVYG